MLNIDIIQHILSYNDDLRVLKIKMNKQNIKYLFENIKELYAYLWCMKGYLEFTETKEENIYITIIELLSNKNYNMNEIRNNVSYLDYDDLFEYYIAIIINNYNNYYLDDNYYYNGYWWKNYWLLGEGKKFYDGYPRILKIKMNEKNMKHLIENNSEIYSYLRCMDESSFPSNVEENIYRNMIFLMMNKYNNMEQIKNHILSFPHYNQRLNDPEYDYRYNIRNENWFKYFINIIINNYNNYYLNDKYYYKGYWYENKWFYDDNKNFYDGYPRGFPLFILI